MADRSKTRAKAIVASFYQTAGGTEPVRVWLRSRDLDDRYRRVIGGDIQVVEYSWPDVGKPLVAPLKGGIWEVRSTRPSRRIARVLFGVEAGLMIILHGFVKKTQATADGDLRLARRRLADWKENNP